MVPLTFNVLFDHLSYSKIKCKYAKKKVTLKVSCWIMLLVLPRMVLLCYTFSLQAEIDELKQRVSELTEAKSQLDSCNHKLLEESTYAKGLASVTSVELKALSVKVTKLMKQNERLSSELASGRNQRRGSHGPRGARRENHTKRYEPARRGDMNALEAMLKEKDQRQAELHTKIEESKQKEAFLEKELANMWTVLANLKKTRGIDQEDFDSKYNGSWA